MYVYHKDLATECSWSLCNSCLTLEALKISYVKEKKLITLLYLKKIKNKVVLKNLTKKNMKLIPWTLSLTQKNKIKHKKPIIILRNWYKFSFVKVKPSMPNHYIIFENFLTKMLHKSLS